MSPQDGTVFTEQKLNFDLDSNSTLDNSVKFSVKIDERGRISLPADLRKTFGLNKGDQIILNVSVTRAQIILKLGDENG